VDVIDPASRLTLSPCFAIAFEDTVVRSPPDQRVQLTNQADIASGITTQPTDVVIGVLNAIRGGATINAAANAVGINFRTAQRIVQAAERQRLIPALTSTTTGAASLRNAYEKAG
jgi:dTDP-4-dehydrorhamnose reductase